MDIGRYSVDNKNGENAKSENEMIVEKFVSDLEV